MRAEEMLTAVASQTEDEFVAIERAAPDSAESLGVIREDGSVRDNDLEEVVGNGRQGDGEVAIFSSSPDNSEAVPSENDLGPDRTFQAVPASAESNICENIPISTTTMSLDSVLALHTARRMKSPSKKKRAPKRGISIPSQRRFLFYWSQLISNVAPSGFWAWSYESSLTSSAGVSSEPTGTSKAPLASVRQVRLREIKVRMQHFGGPKATAVKMINRVLDKSAMGNVSAFLYFPLNSR